MKLAEKYNLLVIEDAAQAIESFYTGVDGVKRALGSIGHLAAFSFHETKNIISGEGGLLAINDDRFVNRAEIIWEKGTNRAEFFRGEVNKYGWVDIGSSFLPSEIVAAYLWAQLENIETIQKRRVEIWEQYHNGLISLLPERGIRLPTIPEYATNNGHMFYLVCDMGNQRDNLINQLKNKGVHAVFHYQSLHKSEYYKAIHGSRVLPNAEKLDNSLVRLPLFFELQKNDINKVIFYLSNMLFD